MAQLAQVTVTINAMQAQIKTLSTMSANTTITKSKFYFCSCGSNFTHGIKTRSSNKTVHKEEIYPKKKLGVGKKGCKLRLGEIMNKIKISTPKPSLINNIRTPPNSPSRKKLAIADSGSNINLFKQATPTKATVIITNDIQWERSGLNNQNTEGRSLNKIRG